MIDFNGRFGSCNVAGFTREKFKFFRKIFENYDVMCIQETHGEKKDSLSRVAKLGFSKGCFSVHTKATRGSAVVWKDSFKQVGDAWDDSVDERITEEAHPPNDDPGADERQPDRRLSFQ